MSDLYDTHEQGERVKNWLRENGSAIVMGLVLAFGLMFGFKQWQVWETSKRQQASAEYQVMATLIKSNNIDAAVSNYEVLKAEFPKSAYTSMAALMMAKARVFSGQFDLASSDLEYAMEYAQPDPVKVIARERLARLRLSQGDADAALKLLDEAPSEVGFEAQFAEVRGDIYVAKGETELAIGSYQASLEALEESVGNPDLLKFKLEALGAVVGEANDLDKDSGGGEM
ncbi:MAG: tetratricopeptide repeat protein [Xanthomonadales bacterium]|nr:tetratricopeptide repeat protein [Xanthomonadales bacterium]